MWQLITVMEEKRVLKGKVNSGKQIIETTWMSLCSD